MQSHRKSYITAAIIGLIASALILLLFSRYARSGLIGQLLWRLELATYDFRISHSIPNTQSDHVVIVTIDEESISQLGVWPWPRGYHARVLERLKAAGAKVVGLDMILSTVSNPEAAEESAEDKPLDWEPPPGKDDLILEKSLQNVGNAVMSVSFIERKSEHGDIGGEISDAQFPYWRFEEAAHAIGVVNIPKDVDGSIRRCWTHRMYQDEAYFTMPLVLAAMYLGQDPGKLESSVVGLSGIRNSNSDGFQISYRGKPGVGFKYLPYYQVLREGAITDLNKQVKDKIVLVGATANALQDRHDTPLSLGMRGGRETRQASQMPGVEVMASAIDTILNRNYIRPANPILAAVLACVLSLLVSVIVVKLRPLIGLAGAWLPGQIMALLIAFSAWQSFHIWIPLVMLSLGITLSYVGTTIYLELTTERQRRSLQQSWARRVSPEVLQVILDTPELTQVGGRHIIATMLFTDLRGFTTFCHESTPEHVVEVLNECLAMITRVIRAHGGTVHKFIGDGVMAVFGDPVPQPDHARRAIFAACEMQKEMAQLRKNLADNEWLPYLRVGIHTGELVAGDIGSKELLEYTVIGDTVSTASRLESLNKDFNTEIMISKATHESAGNGFTSQPLGLVEIRGRTEAMEVFSIDPWKSQKRKEQ